MGPRRRSFVLGMIGALANSNAGGTAAGGRWPLLEGVTSKGIWQDRRQRILARIQEVMGQHPDRPVLPLAVEEYEREELPSVFRIRLSYQSEERDRVPAYLLLPRGLKKPAPAALCLHQTTRIGKGQPAGTGDKPDLHYALELAERGYVTLAPDYPNFGDYTFDPYAHGYASATMKGIWNHQRGIDLLQSREEVDPQRIGAIGHSLGGHNSLFVSVFDERLRAVITSCGFNTFYKYKGGDLTGWSHRGYMPRIAAAYGKDPARMPFDFPEILAALAPRAVFINAPTGDANFEVSGVRDCVEAAKPIYEHVFHAGDRLAAAYPDAGHEFPAAIRQQAYAFFDKWI